MDIARHSPALNLYNRLTSWPAGKWLFSRLICFKAPYFGSIRPRVESLENGRCTVRLAKRRSVTNHIGTIHAIALCNGAELAAGTMMEASVARGMRWIPKGMTVKYEAKAETDVKLIAEVASTDWDTAQDVVVPVIARDRNGKQVFSADITMYVSPKRPKA